MVRYDFQKRMDVGAHFPVFWQDGESQMKISGKIISNSSIFLN
jgi:hypothetical protein